MKHIRWLAPLLLGVLLSSPALARTDAEVREAIQEELLERHPNETGEWWRALGPNAPAVIISLYESSSHTYHRLRLLQGLGWFDSQLAVDFLKKQAENATDDVLKTTAIRSIGYGQGAKETDYLAKYLSNGDPQIRLAAAESLQKIHDPKAEAIVQKYLKEEKAPWVVAKLKGESVLPRSPLAQTGSSEDRLNPEFDGHWEGFWLLPRSPNEEGLRQKPATLNLKLESVTQLKGELILKEGKKYVTWKLSQVTGKGSKFSGHLDSGAEPAAFEAEVRQEAGTQLLELHVRKTGAILVVRKKVSSAP